MRKIFSLFPLSNRNIYRKKVVILIMIYRRYIGTIEKVIFSIISHEFLPRQFKNIPNYLLKKAKIAPYGGAQLLDSGFS